MKKLSSLVALLVFVLSFAGCTKEQESEPQAEQYQATVVTYDVTYLSNKYIRARFSYSSPKFDAQTKYKGIIVSTENTPTIENGIKGKSSFRIDDDENYFDDLQVNTKYYYRGFATDGTTVVYGDVKTFTTTNASTPTLVSSFHVGTANDDGSFDVGIKVKNSYLVQEWGVELYVDYGISTSSTKKWFYSEAPREEIDWMNFKYGHQGYPYYKGSKLVKRSYIKTISGVTTYTSWSYFYIP